MHLEQIIYHLCGLFGTLHGFLKLVVRLREPAQPLAL
jgi:hypothetical protein